ncbi:hypothetical protein PI126_g15730 [Phytophthora idaei]|nr:hypothetical protein PI126_g15730 [Phytophthora idaei]
MTRKTHLSTFSANRRHTLRRLDFAAYEKSHESSKKKSPRRVDIAGVVCRVQTFSFVGLVRSGPMDWANRLTGEAGNALSDEIEIEPLRARGTLPRRDLVLGCWTSQW